MSARKKTRDNHDFNPQSSCLMPQASCTANRTFTLWRISCIFRNTTWTNVVQEHLLQMALEAAGSAYADPWSGHGWNSPGSPPEKKQSAISKNPAVSVDNRSRMLTPCASCAQVGFNANAGQKCDLSLTTISWKQFLKPMVEILTTETRRCSKQHVRWHLDFHWTRHLRAVRAIIQVYMLSRN